MEEGNARINNLSNKFKSDLLLTMSREAISLTRWALVGEVGSHNVEFLIVLFVSICVETCAGLSAGVMVQKRRTCD